MDPVLARHDDPLVEGRVVARPNRFVLTVDIDGSTERVYLADPGALAFLDPGTTVLCSPVDAPGRKTDWDAIAAALEDGYVSLKAVFANDLFLAAFRAGLLSTFEGYRYVESEPSYPMRGRADFLLAPPAGDHDVYVEVKSCTHEEDGVGKFPDRQTKRGRRQLRCLEAIERGGSEAHVVFVAQHPSITSIAPFREVDPEFAELLGDVAATGVSIHGIATAFKPPTYHLLADDIPVAVD
jgi:sugar fermentation stimulation protein A